MFIIQLQELISFLIGKEGSILLILGTKCCRSKDLFRVYTAEKIGMMDEPKYCNFISQLIALSGLMVLMLCRLTSG